MSQSKPKVSAIICTADRGDSVVATIQSLLENTYPSFEVLVIDQSDDDSTQQAVAPFKADPRFRYIRSDTKGSGRAHNIGLSHTNSDVVVYTDDDCTVPPNWIAAMAKVFERHPRVAVAFCNVDPAPHNADEGFIPIYVRHDSKLVRTMWDKCTARGIGAGMGVRREAVMAMGGFDNTLGPGGMFRACMDGDLAVRALLHNWWVYETHEVAVLHYGFRTWKQGKALTQRAWYGIGAAYAKPLKAGHWRMLPVVIYEAVIVGVLHPLSRLLRLKKPQGIKQIVYFSQGFFKGLMTPIDRKQMVYKAD